RISRWRKLVGDPQSATQNRKTMRGACRRLSCRSRRVLALHIFETGSLATQTAKVIKLGAADFGRTHQLNPIDHARAHRENAFHTLPEADLADGEAGLRPTRSRQHHAFERLQALFLAFFDLDVNADGVTRDELGKVGTR